MESIPKVSVCMITYNHEEYIKQAIEGILIQQTNFNFELVIGEDCSTDNTRRICEEYALLYTKIKLLPSLTNLGVVQNLVRTLQTCKGKYIAICEGDDYWTDPNKLQKQVDFLEANDEYSLCFHRVSRLQNGVIANETKDRNPEETLLSLARKIDIPTLSVVFRKIDFCDLYKNADNLTGSYFLFMLLAKHGKFKFIDETMAVYRVHSGGIWSGKGIYGKAQMQLKNKRLMIEHFCGNKEVKDELTKSFIDISTMYFLKLLIRGNMSKALSLYSVSLKYGMLGFHVKSLFNHTLRR